MKDSLCPRETEVEENFAMSTPQTRTQGKRAIGYGALQLVEHFIYHFSSLFLLKPFVIKLQPEVEELSCKASLQGSKLHCSIISTRSKIHGMNYTYYIALKMKPGEVLL